MKIEMLTRQFGCIVSEVGLAEIPRSEIIELLKLYGVIVFRGLDVDQARFEAFADQFGTSKREVHPSVLGCSREVTTGRGRQALHGEFCVLPCITPDLVWFYCVRPAVRGGRTTVADGIAFLNSLSACSYEFLSGHRLLFRIAVDERIWASVFGKSQTLAEFASSYPQLTYQVEREVIQFKCIRPAIVRAKFCDQEAFVNPVLQALDFPQYYRLSLEDAERFPQGLIPELVDVAGQITVAIPWRERDFALIDNSRVMHGREAFEDPARKILARHAMAIFT